MTSLPMLASMAAAELELHRQGEPTEFGSVHELATYLEKSIKKPVTGSNPQPFMDHGLASIFVRSMRSAATVDDLVKEALAKTESLKKAVKEDEGLASEDLKVFCVALSDAAAQYESRFTNNLNRHPARV